MKTKDKTFEAKLIDASLMKWLLSNGSTFSFKLHGRSLLVWCPLLPTASLTELLDAVKGFSDHIPKQIWTQYKIG